MLAAALGPAGVAAAGGPPASHLRAAAVKFDMLAVAHNHSGPGEGWEPAEAPRAPVPVGFQSPGLRLGHRPEVSGAGGGAPRGPPPGRGGQPRPGRVS